MRGRYPTAAVVGVVTVMLVPAAVMAAIPAIMAAEAIAIHGVMRLAMMPAMRLGVRLDAGANRSVVRLRHCLGNSVDIAIFASAPQPMVLSCEMSAS